MIERFTFVRLREEHVAERAAIAAHLRARLAAQPETVAVSAGTPADESARSWDVSLVVRCADLDHLAALLAREEIDDLLGAWLTARAVVIKAWSFDVI